MMIIMIMTIMITKIIMIPNAESDLTIDINNDDYDNDDDDGGGDNT